MLYGEGVEKESLGGSRDVVSGEIRFGSFFDPDFAVLLLALSGRLGLCLREAAPPGGSPNLSMSASFRSTTVLLFNNWVENGVSSTIGAALSSGDTERGRGALGLVLLYKETLGFFFNGLLYVSSSLINLFWCPGEVFGVTSAVCAVLFRLSESRRALCSANFLAKFN